MKVVRSVYSVAHWQFYSVTEKLSSFFSQTDDTTSSNMDAHVTFLIYLGVKEQGCDSSPNTHQLFLHILITRGTDKDRVLHQTHKAPESVRFIQHLSENGSN